MKKNKKYGGRVARNGNGPLWIFTEKHDGSFTCPDAEYISNLYFPLMNEAGMKSWTTPELKGDIAKGYHFYFNTPTVTDELWRSSASRNFWIKIKDQTPWSVTGVSAERNWKRWDKKPDEHSLLEAGLGWFKMNRTHKKYQLIASVTQFIPCDGDFVEVNIFEIYNTGKKDICFFPTAATPMFGRSTENVRDHKQVTTLFQKIWHDKFGVRIKGNIVHDERGGHIPNNTYYATYGSTGSGKPPKYIWGSMADFIGEGGTLDNPEVVWKGLKPPKIKEGERDGTEAVGALQFEKITCKAGEKTTYIVLHMISEDPADFIRWQKKYGTLEKATNALEKTKTYWLEKANNVSFHTPDDNFNNWCRWLAYQVKCRQIFGNAYLPDFDYGKGGRGWRDLWQDLLSIFLIDPDSAKQEILNNFLGVRIDGTNANLIGNKSGEFFSDVNRIDRTWSDHSAWPLFVVNFYLHQTGDYDILMKQVPYWKDHVFRRSKDIDKDYVAEHYGTRLLTYDNTVYEGSILEHLILQNVCSFFNVGKNNNILLEAADWNDTYDNARTNGESVCFYNFFAYNLKTLAQILSHLSSIGIREIAMLEETLMLFDSLPGQKKIDYADPEAKQSHLQNYHDKIRHKVSGRKVNVPVEQLIADVTLKADHIYEHIRTNEWIISAEGKQFFNGHYDNDSIRVHGDHPNGLRIDLTSQVLPVICGTATDDKIPLLYDAVNTYLKDKTTGGLRLNTDLKELKLNLGRVCAFAYGYKEHGSKWMHQNIMFLYGLYSRGFVNEGYEVFKGIYKLVKNSGQSKIFPSIPSFFNRFGRGMYVYLTGSATWFILSFVTQVFGIRGEKGNLCINPKLVKEQFGKNGKTALQCYFKNKKMIVTYNNMGKKEWNNYAIQEIKINGQTAPFMLVEPAKALILASEVEKLCYKKNNIVDIVLV